MERTPFCIVTKDGRTVKSDILESYAIKEGEITRQIKADQFAGEYSNSGLMPPLYNPEILAKVLEMNTYHYRCVYTKARDTAGLGWSLKPLTENPNEKERERLDTFFSGIAPSLSIVLTNMQKDVESVGYGALELIRENYDPTGLPATITHIPAHTLRIHRSGYKFQQKRGTKTRWFKAAGYEKDVDMDTGEEHEIGELPAEKRATEILWFVNYTPRSDYYGLPDIIPAIGAVHGDIARRDYNIAFFDNYGIPAYAVFITGNFDPGTEDATTHKTPLEQSIEDHFKEIKNSPHSTLILSVPSSSGEGEVKVEFVPLSTGIKEASFRLYRQDNRDEILAVHGVPGYRIGISEAGALAGNLAEEATEIYKRSVIAPRQEIIESIINRVIVWDAFEAEAWAFKLSPIDTTDESHDLEMVGKLFIMGAMTPNQIIAQYKDKFGLDKVKHPAMDAHYINGYPIDLEEGLTLPQTREVEDTLKSLKALMGQK